MTTDPCRTQEHRAELLALRLYDLRQRINNRTPDVPGFLAGLPDGDFAWDGANYPSDAHAYACGESDCPVGWHTISYGTTIRRQNGLLSIEIDTWDQDGNRDQDDGYDQEHDDSAQLEYVVSQIERQSDDYFLGWAEYFIHCAESGTDPLDNATSQIPARLLDQAERFIRIVEDHNHG